MPEKHGKLGLACLRVQRRGSAIAETWHRRLGHPGDRKLNQMIKDGISPREAAAYPAAACETCQLTHPRRRPIPKIAKRSGKVVVQLDYMPLGQQERGWKGEVGAYVFSSRSSKLLKAYPVTTASAEDAVHTLQKYCTSILPLLGGKVEAGNGFRAVNLRTVTWRGDWDLFKEEFVAAVECSGTSNAVELAERLAEGERLDDLGETDKSLVREGLAESHRLKTQLTLSLITTEGTVTTNRK